ncbi:MAG: endopeptidase La [Bdellovibrionales bacterium]|nr:endopeptidase La [Bdellovibrionales bacterium]
MDASKQNIELPELIPLLPIRNTVLFPNTAVPLIVGRTKSVRTVRQAQKMGDLLLVVTQKDPSKDKPQIEDLFSVGVVCIVSKISQLEKDSLQVIANGLFRFQITELVEHDGYLAAKGFRLPEVSSAQSERVETIAGEIRQVGKIILTLSGAPGAEALIKLLNQINDPAQIADLGCTFIHLTTLAKQRLLEMSDLEERLHALLSEMLREKERLVLHGEIHNKMMDRLSKDQREQLLREQLKTITEELGDDPKNSDGLAKRIEEAGFPNDILKLVQDEFKRLNSIPKASPEHHVIRTYLDWLLAVPWKKTSGTPSHEINLISARAVLEVDHFGIEKVKKRILQFLAVAKLKKEMKGPILCLVGPPGVGKTSIAQSMAKALGRTFVRISLGGVRDEAEIRGHRRTYIGALPGRIIQAMKRAGVTDPLILLDEVDKLGNDFRGDPASALLEVLDPEQNHTFVDHYLDVPYDLSKAFFVTTANMIETIPPALKDRLEVIEMTSYSKPEKMEIAKRHLIHKVLSDHGISEATLQITDEALAQLIEAYTREAGVRNLTRELAHLCRYAAEELAGETPPEKIIISKLQLESILGPQKLFPEVVETNAKPGIVTGLAWTPVGGEILQIEVARMEGKGGLILTGQLGDVMKESAQIALSLLRSQLIKSTEIKFDQSEFHIHVPAGAIPKDGPSAGTAIFLALASLIQNKAVSPHLALTGEITLRGNILPVGGVKEKVIAAHRAGIKTILLPEKNKGDLIDVSPEIKNQLTFHYIKDVAEVLKLAGLDGFGFIPTAITITGTSQTTNTPLAN